MKTLVKLRIAGLVALSIAAVAYHPIVKAQQPSTTSQQSTPSSLPTYDKSIVAYVNGQPISRQELADDLIARKGHQHIQLMINRRIIEQAAKNAGVTVTEAEVDAEVSQ